MLISSEHEEQPAETNDHQPVVSEQEPFTDPSEFDEQPADIEVPVVTMQPEIADQPTVAEQLPGTEQPGKIDEPVAATQLRVEEQFAISEQPQPFEISSEDEAPIGTIQDKNETEETEQTANAGNEQETVSAIASPVRKITFQVKFNTTVGQLLFVTGNHTFLGDKDYAKAFPLSYLNDDYWFGTLEIPEGETLSEPVTYNYLLKDVDGSIHVDWGNDKIIEPAAITTEEALLIDTWNSSSFNRKYFLYRAFPASAFKRKLYRS